MSAKESEVDRDSQRYYCRQGPDMRNFFSIVCADAISLEDLNIINVIKCLST